MKKLRNLLAVASACCALVPTASINAAILTVSNANDSGAGSLRQAINDANQNPGPDTIVFNIPTSSPGFNGTVFTINPLSALPPLTGGGTTIDGATQAGFTGNTNPAGPEVMLNGSQVGFVGGGLAVTSSGNIIRSLVLNGFNNTGIDINGVGATFNTITGCYLGTNPAGNSAVPNTFDGLAIRAGANNNTIGGIFPSERNLISGNARNGITIQDITVGSGANNNTVEGNYIGTNLTGQSALGNGVDGIIVGPAASGNVLGGTTVNARNVISGNGQFGVHLAQGNNIANNLIQGNLIGTDVSESAAIPNGGGVGIFQGALNNRIGGAVPVGALNVISGNTGNGVTIVGNNNTTGNSILSNSIYNNGGLGIDLGGDGPRSNDQCDTDTGPDNLQNYPVLTSITTSGGNVRIVGTINSLANTMFRLEFFGDDVVDPSNFGEGRFFLGSSNVTTDGSCNGAFDVSFVLVPGARTITATATDPNGNTSEFSALPPITSPVVATGTVGLPFTYQFTASGATSLGASNLPAGLTFSTSLGAITGIPTTAGIFQVGLSATNSQGTLNGTLTVTVQPAPSGLVFVSSTAATGRTGRPFGFQLQTKGGSSATRFTVENVLPPGFNLDQSTGFISGTPTSDGSFGLSVSAIDGTATTNRTLQLTFTSDPTVPIITSPATAKLAPGQFFSYSITADGNGTFGYIGSDGIVHQAPSPSCAGLPAGLCFDGDHTISGTFNPPFGSDRGSRTRPNQSGGIITNVQLFAANPPNGTGIIPLFPLLAASGATNIATRLAVGIGENVLIGGFIIAESVAGSGGPKKVVIRAVGPSLTQFGVPNALQDSTLELRDGAASLLGSNDNWRDAQGQANQIIDARLQPTDDREAAILAYLNPGQYTALVSGKSNSTGNALVEVYDLGTVLVADTSNSRLANIATRGTVLGGDSVMIGGVIIASPNTRVVVRAIGPSLTPFGIIGALQDPTLDLVNAQGMILRSNDDWGQGQSAEVQEAGLAPTDPRESALIETLQEGNYTAIVRGKAGATGVAVVEGYTLQ
jgi:hypothetical protein